MKEDEIRGVNKVDGSESTWFGQTSTVKKPAHQKMKQKDHKAKFHSVKRAYKTGGGKMKRMGLRFSLSN